MPVCSRVFVPSFVRLTTAIPIVTRQKISPWGQAFWKSKIIHASRWSINVAGASQTWPCSIYFSSIHCPSYHSLSRFDVTFQRVDERVSHPPCNGPYRFLFVARAFESNPLARGTLFRVRTSFNAQSSFERGSRARDRAMQPRSRWKMWHQFRQRRAPSKHTHLLNICVPTGGSGQCHGSSRNFHVSCST